MKVKIENLGVLKKAEFELGELTIICGRNNTGKTYATYALLGFLFYWKSGFSIEIPDQIIRTLLNEGAVKINIQQYLKQAQEILHKSCKSFTKDLPMIFASSESNFSDTSFLINIEKADMKPVSTYEREMGTATTQLISIAKQKDDYHVIISLLKEKNQIEIPDTVIKRVIGMALKEIIFGQLFPNPFIASAERTGAAIFRKELDFARNRLLEEMGGMDKKFNPFDLLNKVYSDYTLPVRTNVDFSRQLEGIYKKTSFIAKNHPKLLSSFSDVIEGQYKIISNKGLYYIPNSNKRLKLTINECSSAVRSMLDIGFYLSHVAQPGDLLMIDEPELNLHPENQRRIARLFAQLVNIGIKVFITTHSDYIIKELNTLIMLNNETPLTKQVCEDEGYVPGELISADKIKVFIAEKKLMKISGNTKRTWCYTLTPADIDSELGIEARSFDTTIEDMNRIQEALYFSQEASE